MIVTDIIFEKLNYDNTLQLLVESDIHYQDVTIKAQKKKKESETKGEGGNSHETTSIQLPTADAIPEGLVWNSPRKVDSESVLTIG